MRIRACALLHACLSAPCKHTPELALVTLPAATVTCLPPHAACRSVCVCGGGSSRVCSVFISTARGRKGYLAARLWLDLVAQVGAHLVRQRSQILRIEGVGEEEKAERREERRGKE